MQFSVSLIADGDREVKLEEVVALADAIAIHKGIASGAGTYFLGAQILVDAPNSDVAVDLSVKIFEEAIKTAGLPEWPVSKAETITEDEEWEAIFEESEQQILTRDPEAFNP
jgi:hypothetical protein